MRSVARWLGTPLPLKFWLYAGGATVFVLTGVFEVARAVSIELGDAPPPLSHGLRFGLGIVISFAVGGLLVWRAIRVYRRPS
jgi:hypothetical protein